MNEFLEGNGKKCTWGKINKLKPHTQAVDNGDNIMNYLWMSCVLPVYTQKNLLYACALNKSKLFSLQKSSVK